MADIFDILTRRTFSHEQKQNREDLKIWDRMTKTVQNEIKKYTDNKISVCTVVLGFTELEALQRITTSNNDGRFSTPKTINGIPIILISLPSYCEVVPEPESLYRFLNN